MKHFRKSGKKAAALFRMLAAGVSMGILILQLTGCGFSDMTYANYVQAVLDCSYHNDTAAYCNLTGATEAAAQQLFLQEVQALSEQMRHYYGVRTEMITEKTIASYDALAEQILMQTKYTVRDVQKSGAACEVTLVLQPLDLWERSQQEVKTYYETVFLKKYTRAETKAKADLLEEIYARRICYILRGCVEELSCKEPVQYTVLIGPGAYALTEESWQEIDAILLDEQETAE